MILERRVRDTGPPPGQPDRRATLRRRASDVPKPSCPWCGASTSAVYRSKPAVAVDRYARRRQCAECGRDWPTTEGLDRERFAAELRAVGMTLAELDIPSTDGEALLRPAADMAEQLADRLHPTPPTHDKEG